MTSQTRGQSSHIPGHEREDKLARRWRSIPTSLLRELTIELVARFRLRGVASMAGLSKEAVRKFVSGMSQPTLSTRRKLGELFLDFHPGGVMAEPGDGGQKQWKVRPRLMELLPAGEARARAELRRMFQQARDAGDAPEWLRRVEDWMDLQIRGEYWAERHYGEIGRGANAGQGERPKSHRAARTRKATHPGEAATDETE